MEKLGAKPGARRMEVPTSDLCSVASGEGLAELVGLLLIAAQKARLGLVVPTLPGWSRGGFAHLHFKTLGPATFALRGTLLG